MPRTRLAAVVGLLVAACGTGGNPEVPPTDAPVTGCADVVAVDVAADSRGTFTVTATVSSADTGWDKYADRWEVVAPDGSVLATRVLTHPHVDEQPFSRSQSGVEIPAGVTSIVIRAHDSVEGLCGAEFQVEVPR